MQWIYWNIKKQKKHISKNFFIHDRRRGEEDTICDCNFKNEFHVIREFIIHVNIIARFLFLVTSRQLGNPLLTLQCRSGNPALALHAMILRLLYRQNKLSTENKKHRILVQLVMFSKWLNGIWRESLKKFTLQWVNTIEYADQGAK